VDKYVHIVHKGQNFDFVNIDLLTVNWVKTLILQGYYWPLLLHKA